MTTDVSSNLIAVVDSRADPNSGGASYFLVRDRWDDWFEYETQYRLMVVRGNDAPTMIGDVKIGQVGMRVGQRSPELPDLFSALDESYFSVGQDDSYYENIKSLGAVERVWLLQALRDIAADPNSYDIAIKERVTRQSLFRSVSAATVRGQFRRMARGDARLTEYDFCYLRHPRHGSDAATLELSFEVIPESTPPTNVHVLIGRNGVGKTQLLAGMTRAFIGGVLAKGANGQFKSLSDDFAEDMFSGLVTVSFSAFDSLPPLSAQDLEGSSKSYAYIGLNRHDAAGTLLPPKSPGDLCDEFVASVSMCRSGAREQRWRRAVESLESDPMFEAAEASQLLDEVDGETLSGRAASLFSSLSSGHKIVLLTITRLVELVEERTLVLLDEPESHLHPPLLSAFVAALSDLLTQRNGVAIVATHSPVILQGVTKSCAWKLRRAGSVMAGERPENETFGENVGVLTHDVFSLEVTQSGFYGAILACVEAGMNFLQVERHFGGKLGSEARAIARALVAARIAEQGG